jgi:hypothetical protein
MRRREAIGGVTVAVVGIVLALSVGIAATAKGGVFGPGPTGQALPGAAGTATKLKQTTTRVLVEAVVSQSAVSKQQGLCTVDAHIVAAAPRAPQATGGPVTVIRSRGGRVQRAIST